MDVPMTNKKGKIILAHRWYEKICLENTRKSTENYKNRKKAQ